LVLVTLPVTASDFHLTVLRSVDRATKPTYEPGSKQPMMGVFRSPGEFCDGTDCSSTLRRQKNRGWIRFRIHRGEKFSFHVAPMLRFSLKWFRHNQLTPQKTVIANLRFSWTRN
jgi:hypothetical protein